MARGFDGDWDLHYQLYRFTINLEDLVYNKGWPMPPDISYYDLYAMEFLAIYKKDISRTTIFSNKDPLE